MKSDESEGVKKIEIQGVDGLEGCPGGGKIRRAAGQNDAAATLWPASAFTSTGASFKSICALTT